MSIVDIRAAVRAASTKPKTPGAQTSLATSMKTDFGSVSESRMPIASMALPIQPALPTTIAEIGKRNTVLNRIVLRPSLTLLAARKRMIKPWLMNRNVMLLATPSCQKMPA